MVGEGNRHAGPKAAWRERRGIGGCCDDRNPGTEADML